MEQRQIPITQFIKPLLHSLHLTSDSDSDTSVGYTDVMPLIDVVDTIHHSYYFRRSIVLTFEQYDTDGQLRRYTKNGRVQSNIQENHHFLFESEDISYLLNLEQVVAALRS